MINLNKVKKPLVCDHCEQTKRKPFQIYIAFKYCFTKYLCDQSHQVNKTLLNIKNSWEQFQTKYLCDHCEQSEQNPFKYQKLLGAVLKKILCDQCEQNPFKYRKLFQTVSN